MDRDGRNDRQLTTLAAASFAPSWHPDGKRLVFASNVKDPQQRNFDIFLMNVDGTGLEQVTFNDTFDGFPMFSPDGRASRLRVEPARRRWKGRPTCSSPTGWTDRASLFLLRARSASRRAAAALGGYQRCRGRPQPGVRTDRWSVCDPPDGRPCRCAWRSAPVRAAACWSSVVIDVPSEPPRPRRWDTTY